MAAAQNIADTLFGLAEHVVVMPDLARFARYHAHFAEAAVAVAAAVIKRQSAAQTGFEDGLGAFHEKLVAAGDDLCLCSHNA